MLILPIIAALALGSTGAEPVVWTKMADPDPNYVEPKRPATRKSRKASRRGGEPTDMIGALVNLARAGQEAREAAVRDYEQKLRAAREADERAREQSETPQR